MNHSILLTEIDRYLIPTLAESEVGNKAIGILQALRAVVELHKPVEHTEGTWCSGCMATEWYPCPTIQAIKKELT